IAQYEGYFASVCYSHLASLGVEIIPEDVTHEGQCDLTVKHAGIVWVFEFKVIQGEQATGQALQQLQTKNYAAKYRGAPGVERVIEVGVEFSRSRRQIVGWEALAAHPPPR
ncbi:PD-(D/E)XK nuclease domain-containing protein, partial [Tepidimonas ignava]